MTMCDATRIVVREVRAAEADEWVDGAGWYYWEADYPEEGVVGAFGSRQEALDHAASSGCLIEVSDG